MLEVVIVGLNHYHVLIMFLLVGGTRSVPAEIGGLVKCAWLSAGV